MTVDINCDMGESFGNYHIGSDDAIMPLVSSCNIACGMHAGDPVHIYRTLKNAKRHGLRIGAHPGYPDLQGFGRRHIQLTAEELTSTIVYQVSALGGMAASIGLKLHYVKPHGALYNYMADNENCARIVVQAIRAVDSGLAVMGLAGSTVKRIVESEGSTFIAEAFADRRYTDNGRLLSRQLEGAVLHDPLEAAEQVMGIVNDRQVKTDTGNYLPLEAESICIHGDNPQAVPVLQAIKVALEDNKT